MCKQQAKVKKLKELFNITYKQFTIVSIHVQYTYYLSVNKVAHSGFETQRRHRQKSKTGVSVAPEKDLCPPKTNVIMNSILIHQIFTTKFYNKRNS